MARGNRGGRGGRGRGRGGGGGRGGAMNGAASIADDLDFTIQLYANAPSVNSGSGSAPRGRGGNSASAPGTPNRGRGRGRGHGRGGYDSPVGGRGRGRGRGMPDVSTPRRGDWGIGASPRGRGGRGGGRGAYGGRPTTLSGLLYQERPLLRPIVFVPSLLTKVLFQEEEELIKPGVEDVDNTEQSHIPTADKVARVFSGEAAQSESDSSDEEDEEEIEEVDFDEVSKLFDASANTTTTTIRKSKLGENSFVEEQHFTGFYTHLEPTPVLGSLPTDKDVEDLTRMMEETLSAADDVDVETLDAVVGNVDATLDTNSNALFCMDVQPTPVPAALAPAPGLRPSALRNDDEDDIIVYVAPHPRQHMSPLSTAQKDSEIGEETAIDTSAFTPYVSAASPVSAAIASSSAVPAQETPSCLPQPFGGQEFAFSFQSPAAGGGTPAGARRLLVPPVSTPRQAKAWRRKRGLPVGKSSKRRARGNVKTSFGAFGAMRAEEDMHRDDPRKSERRRGDSDLEWGTDEDEGEEEGVQGLALAELLGRLSGRDKGKSKARDDREDIGVDMDVDPDLQLDPAAMRRFVGGMLGSGAGMHVTMGDVEDGETMRAEDAEMERIARRRANGEGSSNEEDVIDDEEEEDILAAEEAMMISETLEFGDSDDSDDSDDTSDEDADQTPKTSFQARLERLRAKSRDTKRADTSMEGMSMDLVEGSEDEDDFFTKNMTWAENDEDFIQEIQAMLDENEDVLAGRDRKKKKVPFYGGDFDDIDEFTFTPAKRRKDKGKGLPPDLAALWDNDRARKAEKKRERAAARLAAAADPLVPKRSGKKARAAIRTAASLDPTIHVLPNRIIDLSTLVQQIRRFVADIGGPRTMALPPTNKETRKNVHELAIAFGLKSVSKGKGEARYTTLAKTTRSGVRVDEAKVGKIMRRSGGAGARGDSFVDGGGRSGPMPRHREGDEVGKAAPKLTQANIGFRMLALMGWSEGTTIGLTGDSLEVPLTAIIKTTKLGLGATK